MKHPGEMELALFAGNDLGFLARWRVAVHLRTCADCRYEVEGLKFGRDSVRELADELPAEVNWKRLSQEMTANVHVGLAAGECVAPIHARPRLHSWRLATALAAAMLIVTAAMWQGLPAASRSHLTNSVLAIVSFNRHIVPALVQGDSMYLEASQKSIGLTDGSQRAMSLVSAREDGAVAVTVSTQGSVGARFVDPDSGQVTINKVYYAQ